MRSLPIVACLMILLAPSLASAQAPPGGSSQAGLVLQPRPPLAAGVAALPRVAGDTEVAARINRSLAAVEQQLQSAIADCRAQGRSNKASSDWSRTVAVTSDGPHLLSVVAQDEAFCGGPYPNDERFALVYDLQSGMPVNWLRLLPARFAATGALSHGMAGSPAGLVQSQPLLALYRRHYPARLDDVDPAMRDECRDSVQDGFTLWPDAASHTLMIQPTPANHAASACAIPVALTIPVLQDAGAPSALLQALGAP